MTRFLIGVTIVLFLIGCLVMADWLVGQLSQAVEVLQR